MDRYGCLILKLNITWWHDLLSHIIDDDVYDMPDFGKEFEPHVTILYGFTLPIDKELNIIKRLLNKVKVPIEIKINSISSFNTKEYDVLKFDVISPQLNHLNSIFKQLPHVSTYQQYHPHLTISYLKIGKSIKYNKKLTSELSFSSNIFLYSNKFKNKTIFKLGE